MKLKTLVQSASIGNALLWAAMMIASAIILRGTDHGDSMLMLYVVGWMMSSTMMLRLERAAKAANATATVEAGTRRC